MTDVADRTVQYGLVGNESERGHPEVTMPTKARLLVQSIVATFILLGAAGHVQSAETEFVVPSGPMITLQDGRAIEGHIVRIDQTNVVIQTIDGTSQTLPRATVETIAFETVTGRKLVGELVGWTPGIYQLTTSEAAIKVYSTVPAVTTPPEQAIAIDSTNQAADSTELETEQANAPEVTGAGRGSSQAIAAVTVDETANGVAGEGEGSEPVGSQDAALAPTASLSITVSVENSKEKGPPVAFNIELSEPSDSSVVLIYATIDGTAINGQDYEANRGVVVIKPGEKVARIEAPVIDDAEKEGQEHLQLFLTVDPTVAVVENRQIIATIDDDDG